MYHIFALDITEHLSLFLEILIIKPLSMYGQLGV